MDVITEPRRLQGSLLAIFALLRKICISWLVIGLDSHTKNQHEPEMGAKTPVFASSGQLKTTTSPSFFFWLTPTEQGRYGRYEVGIRQRSSKTLH
jgi:hypothetical protein